MNSENDGNRTAYGRLVPGAGGRVATDSTNPANDCLDYDCGTDPKHECFIPPWVHAEDCPYRTQKPRVGAVELSVDNTITVWRQRLGRWDWPSMLVVRCGHCNADTFVDRECRVCCLWARDMFRKYFEGNFRQ
jgi:hypothetical protein